MVAEARCGVAGTWSAVCDNDTLGVIEEVLPLSWSSGPDTLIEGPLGVFSSGPDTLIAGPLSGAETLIIGLEPASLPSSKTMDGMGGAAFGGGEKTLGMSTAGARAAGCFTAALVDESS